MPVAHLLLILLVVVVWGLNFLFVTLSLEEISPLLLCAVRFLLASFPAIFFIKFPATKFRVVAAYGLVMFAMQFGLLFIGMHSGMSTGIASLILQVQVFFSIFFAAIVLREIPSYWQIVGAIISFTGILLVGVHSDKTVSLQGILFILAAAATWGGGNLITKKTSHVNMISLVVWGSFIACLPMFILSYYIEGPTTIVHSYQQLTWKGFSSILYIVCVSTWVGYSVWNWLLTRYSVSTIAPFTLLVPIVAILSSVLILGEPFQSWKLIAGLLVIGGLCINLLMPRIFIRRRVQTELA